MPFELERSEAEQALVAAETFVQFIERLLHDALNPECIWRMLGFALRLGTLGESPRVR
jgi:hypothetical protein